MRLLGPPPSSVWWVRRLQSPPTSGLSGFLRMSIDVGGSRSVVAWWCSFSNKIGEDGALIGEGFSPVVVGWSRPPWLGVLVVFCVPNSGRRPFGLSFGWGCHFVASWVAAVAVWCLCGWGDAGKVRLLVVVVPLAVTASVALLVGRFCLLPPISTSGRDWFGLTARRGAGGLYEWGGRL
ncbi:hypothetical protein RHMOL_Rhmol02G0075700 [Rhododendron molle]|uniref:Uncharacterized protein n=1 Tax=Rhododendron molle TaxID=49168 RepID=A0ACC0PMC6_RHOML|nr:hypothetical protein RHMOL_Rhmol02G0075700 [Rhododendron molle]